MVGRLKVAEVHRFKRGTTGSAPIVADSQIRSNDRRNPLTRIPHHCPLTWLARIEPHRQEQTGNPMIRSTPLTTDAAPTGCPFTRARVSAGVRTRFDTAVGIAAKLLEHVAS
jgi:hypothetical protein